MRIPRGKRPRFTKAERAAILAKTAGHCYLCHRSYTANRALAKLFPTLLFADMEIDHVIARSVGGLDHPGNYLPACRACNRAKSAKSLIQYLREKKK